MNTDKQNSDLIANFLANFFCFFYDKEQIKQFLVAKVRKIGRHSEIVLQSTFTKKGLSYTSITKFIKYIYIYIYIYIL